MMPVMRASSESSRFLYTVAVLRDEFKLHYISPFFEDLLQHYCRTGSNYCSVERYCAILYVPNFRNTKKSAFYFHVPTTSSTTDSDCLCVGMRWADLKGGRHPSLTVNCTAVPNRPRRCADQFNPNNVISMTDIHIYKA